jgi:hypothetical protein
MDELHRLAARLETAGSAVTAAAGGLDRLREAPRAFGADAPGRIGALARELHAQWTAAIGSRRAEAGRAAERLTELAGGLRTAAEAYAATDVAAARRLGTGER